MKYYIYDLYKNGYVKEFESIDEMIRFLGRSTYLNQDWWSNRSESATKLDQKYKNAYLDEINMNFNDMYLGGICGEYYTRRYMFIDDNWKIYDMRVYWEEIKKDMESRKYQVLYDILDEYLMDKSILSAAVALEYNPEKGLVYGVLYSDKNGLFTYTAANKNGRVNICNRQEDYISEYLIGYYGLD